MDCCCPCRARRLFITATKSAWGTTYISATGTAFARQCSGTGMERRVFRGRSGAAVFAGDFESGVWISGSECGVAEAVGAFAAELDEVADSNTQFISSV